MDVEKWKLCLNIIVNMIPIIEIVYHYSYEICRRSLHFIHTCALHDSSLIRFEVQYGALYARSQSILGQNVYFVHSAIIGL